MTVPIEPFAEPRDNPSERLTVGKRKSTIIRALNKHLAYFQTTPRTAPSTMGEIYAAPLPEATRLGARDANELKVNRILHRGLREERAMEMEIDDDVFFDFLVSLKRHLRTSEPDKTVGRHDSWDNLSRLWRCLWSLIVAGSVFWFTGMSRPHWCFLYSVTLLSQLLAVFLWFPTETQTQPKMTGLILMTMSSSGLVGFDQSESDPFLVSIPVARNVTLAQRVAGRDAAGRDITDLCQGFLRSVAASFELHSDRTQRESLQYVLDTIEFSSVEHLRALAEDGVLYDKQGQPVELSSQHREHLKWGGNMGFYTAVDRTFPSPKVVRWLSYSHNIKLDTDSAKLIGGFQSGRPSAILEVNGLEAHYRQSTDSFWHDGDDEKLNPERLEAAIFEFLLTRCPIGKRFGEFTPSSWADEAPARRAMWTQLGIFPRDCAASSRSGVSAERACAGWTSQETCAAVGCCEWSEGACDVSEDVDKDALCSGEGALQHTCQVWWLWLCATGINV